MTSIAARLRRSLDSLAWRIGLILTIGMATAAIVSLLLAEHARVHDFRRVEQDRVVASTTDLARRFAQAPAQTADLLHANRFLGAREPPREWHDLRPDPDLGRLLRAQLGARSGAEAMAMPRELCFPNFRNTIRAAGLTDSALPDCWYVRFRDASGTPRGLAIDLAPFRIPPSSTLDPLFLSLILLASAALSVLVARAATIPLRRLARAAHAFSITVDPEPIPELGPREVRAALQTFNLMQHRVRDGFRERTQILASVTHDLQTPLTRLRLRLEQVEDEPLRERLVSDLAVTQQLVRDGLELARSSESREPWSIADIDSILSSIAEDAAELGGDVRLVATSGVRARVKPNALTRCLGNLVENALRYAGAAEIGAAASGNMLVIEVRDHGPGIPPDMIEKVFEPFRRLYAFRTDRPAGSGLGLTIARAQAQTFGATVTLANHPDGGLSAQLHLPLGSNPS